MALSEVRPVTKVVCAMVTASVTSALLTIGATAAAAAGGTVTGKITFKGTPPPAPAAVKVGANPEKCGTEQVPEVLIGPEGAIRWAVVRIVEAKGAWPATAEAPVLDQRGCKFVPHVVVVPAGKPLKVLNNDGILHNVHTFPQKNAPINVAQPGFKKTMDTTFAQAENVRVGCDVHPWMNSWVIVSDTPFVGVTDATGSFTIPDVPPGSYTVSIWHETLGEQTAKVTVADGQKATLSVAMAAK